MSTQTTQHTEPTPNPAAVTRAAIQVRGLRKAFRDVTVLDGVDLDVAAGGVHALLGPNGAGKTTLVKILATLLRADDGEATVAGHDVRRAPRRVREVISLTGQHAAVDELLTGEENLRLAASLYHLGRSAARGRVAELIEIFDLGAFAGRLVRTYSGGMRRRLDIAIGLVSDPKVVYLDEPTTGLDPRSRQAVWEVIARLAGGGATILLTTQYLEEADRLADLVSVLDGGRIVAEGTPAELKARLGAERAELTFADEDSYRRGFAVLRGTPPRQRSRDAAPDRLDTDAASLRIGVPTDGSAAAVRRLLTELDGNGVDVARLEVRTPTLDDVFFALTGNSARKDNDR